MSHKTDIPEVGLKNPPGFTIDLDRLRVFEAGLDPRYPERSAIPATVLGYGEISTVFAIDAPGFEGLAFKRLPIFEAYGELGGYLAAYETCNRLLQDDVGLCLAPDGYAYFPAPSGRPVFYIIQRREPGGAVGHRAMQRLDPPQVAALFTTLLRTLRRVWDFNRRQARYEVGVDGQISNWALQGFDEATQTLPPDLSLLYMDTSTPLFRVEGREQLDTELFLRSAPSFMRWLLRALFLEDVVNRYYDFHLVTVDLVANFYKEGRPNLIPGLVAAANGFFTGEAADLGVEPVTEKEVKSYYDEDRLIWSLYLGARRLDRFIHTRLLRRDYPYILPGKIKR
jgi:hypothetical protein